MQHPTHYIERAFYLLGGEIGKRPVAVIAACLFSTLVMCIGIVNFQETNNVRSDYSPLNAASQTEYQVAKEFLKQNGTMDPCYIMTHARDGGSLLRDEYRWLIYNLTKALQSEVKIVSKGQEYGYVDLCEPYCELNTAFLAFLKLYDPENPSTHTYPAIELFGTQAFIANNVYGIKLKPGTNQLESFKTAVLPFYLVSSYEDTDVLIAWIQRAIEIFEDPEYSTLLKTGMTGDNLVSDEVRKMGFETAPLIFGSIVAMIVFVVASSFRYNRAQSKPWESLVGCLIPLLALAASLGVMSTLGMTFQSIVVAALFLVLSVGVDDVFIIIRAWDRSDPTASIVERTALMLEEAGPSITISSLTNVMSFAIGATTDTPAIRTFCIYSAVAILICYFYQLVMFSAIMALSGRREVKGYQSVLCCFKADPQARSEWVLWFGRLHDGVCKHWGVAVTKWYTRVGLLFVMLAYFCISFIGIREMQTNIAIDKMALPESYLHDFQNAFETALRNMQPISVFVRKPGDLRDPEHLERVKQLVNDFEAATNSYGPDSTFFWLRPYEDFLRFYGETDEFTYTEIPTFFKSATYFYLASFVHLNETACDDNLPECVESFFFVTNFHEVIKYHELIPAVRHWRALAAAYADLDVYAYSDHVPFVDQTMSIDRTVFGSVAAALACTAVICFIFIPHVLSVIAAVFSVFSISWGIFGMLSLWSIDLDPLSMAALLMAIGFSVDFTAHISFHYYKAPEANPRKKIQHALLTIGWPMVQVGLSTIVALLPLLFKQSYLALVFLKTIVVVVMLGMFHGLVVLPVVLTMVTPYSKGSSPPSSADSSERSSQRSSERKESFYKTQNLIKPLHHSAKWINQSGMPAAHRIQKSLKKSLSVNRERIRPINVEDLANTVCTPPTAMVHKIPLGRSQSNAL